MLNTTTIRFVLLRILTAYHELKEENTVSTALGRVCAACGTERKRKGIMYDPTTLFPYCENPYVCNENHPNAPANLIARGSELKLVSFAEAEELFKKHLEMNQPTGERAEKIRRMVTQPITLRIGSPELAIFILDLQDEYQFSSVSDTIRYCIQMMKDSKGRFYKDHADLAEAKAEEKRIEQAEHEVAAMLEKKPAPEKNPFDDEEEMTF